MKIEQQVVSLELAKKLKELGVKQVSLFYWVYVNHGGYWEIDAGINDYHHFPLNDGTDCSAFTVAELGEMLYDLANKIDCGDSWYDLTGQTERPTIGFGGYPEVVADTEADARAKMVICLLEDSLIQVK